VITVSTESQSEEPPPLPAKVVTSLVRSTLTENDIDTGRVQVIFADDEYLRRLNREFFGQDHDTDVIAFNLNETGEPLEGEIYINQERALENSQLYHERYARELMRLVIHGTLHLSGCDDDTPEGQTSMRALEDRLLASVSEFPNHERRTS